MDYVIGILSERLTRLENAWTEFVISGKVSEDSPTAKQKVKEMNELKTAIKILNIPIVTQRSELLNAFFEYLDSLPPKEYDANSLTGHGENWLKIWKL